MNVSEMLSLNIDELRNEVIKLSRENADLKVELKHLKTKLEQIVSYAEGFEEVISRRID